MKDNIIGFILAGVMIVFALCWTIYKIDWYSKHPDCILFYCIGAPK